MKIITEVYKIEFLKSEFKICFLRYGLADPDKTKDTSHLILLLKLKCQERHTIKNSLFFILATHNKFDNIGIKSDLTFLDVT